MAILYEKQSLLENAIDLHEKVLAIIKDDL